MQSSIYWCRAQYTGIESHMLVWSPICWYESPHTSMEPHILVWSPTYWCRASYTGMEPHILVWNSTYWCRVPQQVRNQSWSIVIPGFETLHPVTRTLKGHRCLLQIIDVYYLETYTCYMMKLIYGCIFAGKSKEAEVKRINKELANIRSKFKGNIYLFTYFIIINKSC